MNKLVQRLHEKLTSDPNAHELELFVWQCFNTKASGVAREPPVHGCMPGSSTSVLWATSPMTPNLSQRINAGNMDEY